MPRGPELGSVAEVTAVADFSRYLPEFVAERVVVEAPVLRERLLKLLSCDPSPPNASQLSFALRCLKAYELQKYPIDAELRASVALALWQLLKQSEALCHRERSRIVDSLRRWLRKVVDADLPKEWMAVSKAVEVVVEGKCLTAELDVRLPIELLMAEMRTSLRTDSGTTEHQHRHFASHLANLLGPMSKFVGAKTGLELAGELTGRLDSEHCYGMLYARLLVVLTPANCVPQLVLSGRLWQWWSTLPEGLVPKFDLQWFSLLARYAKLRWRGGVSAALEETKPLVAAGFAGKDMTAAEGAGEAECDAELRKQWPWLFNKVCRTLTLPSFSPAFESTPEAGRTQNPPEMDRYAVPSEIDQIVMGSTSTWKRVAKFIVYSLEAAPPAEASADPSSSMWAMLTLLVRRMHVFMRPGTSTGEWVWHCTTLNHYLVLGYYKRVCRERLIPCAALPGVRLTKEADDAFIGLLLPMVNDSLASFTYEAVTNLENLTVLSRLASMLAPSVEPGEEVVANPFSVDVRTMLLKATEALNDAAESSRHIGLLQTCSCSFPAIIMRWPETIGGIFSISLWGIDATDIGKTLSSLALLVSAFSQVPCLDTNDWSSGGGPEAPESSLKEWRWPQAAGIDLRRQEGSSGVAMLAATLPNFALDLFETYFEYISKIPKPAGRGGPHAEMEHLVTSLIHVTAYLVAAQCDPSTYDRLCKATLEFVERNLLENQAKAMKLLVSAVARANPEVAVPMLLPPLVKKLLQRQKGGDSAVAPLHESGASESETSWLLNAITAIIRHAGPVLLEYRGDLETIILAALMDERAPITKLGVKLLRRILFTLTSTYVANDFRLCGFESYQKLMKARRGEGASKDAWPLKWHGWTPPWWTTEAPSVRWHVPSEKEIAWAKALVHGVMGQFVRLLGAAVPAVTAAAVKQEVATVPGGEWLDGLQLPPKKKACHSACVALKLASVVFRGTNDLWPDERGDTKFEDSFLPSTSPFPGDEFGRTIFEFFSNPMLIALQDLAAQEQFPSSTSAASPAAAAKPAAGSVLDPMEVPKVMKKLINCIGELMGAMRQFHRGAARFFPSGARGHSGDYDNLHGISLHASAIPKLHPHSKLRELPRMWWVLKVSDLMDLRREERMGGHRFEGRRKAIMEALCQISLHASFQEVKGRAQQILSFLCRFHIGSRWALTKGIVLPALSSEVEAVQRCGALRGEEASSEEKRLNNSLSGVASVIGGGVQGVITQAWRRGVDDAATIGLNLCEAIYTVTKLSDAALAAPTNNEKKCEVETLTITRLIAATRIWLDSRETHLAQDKADARPTGELEELEVARSGRSGFGALEAVEKLLSICERTDCFWRAQVMCSTVALALLSSLQKWAQAETSKGSLKADEVQRITDVWKHWLRWLMRCVEPKATPVQHQFGVHGLMLMLKRPAPLTDKHLQEAGLCELAFFEKLLAILPPLRHDDLVHQGERGGELEPTKDAVDAMTDRKCFKLWPRVWIRRSSSSFALWNALFWQSYFAVLERISSADNIVAILARGAEHLSTQPVAEAEFHATLSELTAGALRALRKDSASALRQRAWSSLHPWLSAEVQKGSQGRLEDWCDAIRYIVRGTSKPLLKRKLFQDDVAADAAGGQDAFLTPLFNFVLNIEACPDDASLNCGMSPIRYEGDDLKDCLIVEGTDSYKPPARSEASSFEVYKRLRLLMSLLVEPSAVKWIAANDAFCSSILEALRPGLGHPYKQLREESARSIYLVLRAARTSGADSGLGKAAARTETWLGDEAQRLLPMLREDNASAEGRDKEAESRPAHIVESSGMCYVLLHTALARQSAVLLDEVVPRCVEFLVVATVHDDFELRVLASHALNLCCVAHSLTPRAIADTPWCRLGPVRTVSRLLNGEIPLSDKEMEKAISGAARPALLGNLFILSCGDATSETRALLATLRSFTEAALAHSKPQVRSAAKNLFTSVLVLDADADLLACVKRMKGLAGPVPKNGQELECSQAVITGVVGLSCALFAAADRGVPSWTGRVVQNIAPYGRKGMSALVLKEVQATVQAFLKLMQSRNQAWKECQEKLTEAQLDLLDANKGKLSYFS